MSTSILRCISRGPFKAAVVVMSFRGQQHNPPHRPLSIQNNIMQGKKRHNDCIKGANNNEALIGDSQGPLPEPCLLPRRGHLSEGRCWQMLVLLLLLLSVDRTNADDATGCVVVAVVVGTVQRSPRSCDQLPPPPDIFHTCCNVVAFR